MAKKCCECISIIKVHFPIMRTYVLLISVVVSRTKGFYSRMNSEINRKKAIFGVKMVKSTIGLIMDVNRCVECIKRTWRKNNQTEWENVSSHYRSLSLSLCLVQRFSTWIPWNPDDFDVSLFFSNLSLILFIFLN